MLTDKKVYIGITKPATIHWCTGTSRYFLPWYEYRILNKLLRYLWYIYICINKHGKALSQLVLTLLPLMHDDFPNKLTRKIHAEQCLVLYSRWRTQTHACFQCQLYRLLSPRARHKVTGMLCNVSYRVVSYRIVTTESGYVSYREEMYRCRPRYY